MLFSSISLILIISIIVFIFVSTSPQFGDKTKGEDLKRMQLSPNYTKKGNFKNVEFTLASTGFKISSIPKFFMKGIGLIPEKELPQKNKSTSFFDKKPENPRITWFGHSSLLLEMENKTIFIDPMLGEVPSPHPILGNSRFNKELPIAIDSLPKMDVVLISHDHYDHLDYGSIQKIHTKVSQFLVPLGIKAHLTKWGVDPTKIKEFDWWESIKLGKLEYISTPARHFSGRGFTRNNTLWCSWVIKSNNHAIFFSGDSGYGDHFKKIGDKYGPFDFAMMECGQYDEQWSHIHMTPEETVEATIDVQAKLMMPIHFGAFKLALHTWKDPIERVTKKAKELNQNITTPMIGESIVLNKNYPISKWWK